MSTLSAGTRPQHQSPAIVRAVAVTLLVLLTLVVQVTVLPFFSVADVTPNLVLVVVVAAALARGSEYGAVIGFASGLLLDLAPPADHIAGRWALALVLVGYLAGRVRIDTQYSVAARIITVAACSFVGASVYALSGVVLRDGAWDLGQMLPVIGISVVWDVLMAPLVLPAVGALLARLRGSRAAD